VSRYASRYTRAECSATMSSHEFTSAFMTLIVGLLPERTPRAA
jgi:hypothetical protein